MQENLIKKVCKELNLTYKQLGEAIGYSESAISNAAATGKISNQVKKAIELYLENLQLKQELEKYNQLKKLLKEITNS